MKGEGTFREYANIGESYFKTLLECAAEGIEALDVNGVILYATPSMAHLLGYRPEGLLGMRSHGLVHSEDRSAWEAVLAKAMENRGHSTAPVVLRIRHNDGSWRHMERTVKALQEPWDNTVFVVSSRDITEHKESYEEVRESEHLFRSLTECPVAGICVVQGGVFAYTNATFAELFGYTAAELAGRNWDLLVFFEDIPLVGENIRRLGAGEVDGVHYEFRGITKNREIIEIELYGNHTYYRGQPAVIGTLLDIRHRKNLEQALSESEGKFRVLAERSMAGIYAVQEGIITYANPRFAEIYGYEVDEIIGMQWKNVVYPDDIPMVRENIRKRESGQIDSIRYEFRGLKKNKEVLWIEAYGTRTTIGGKPTAIGTQLDITERKRLEAALLESENRFRDLSEKSVVGIYLHQDGVFAYVNPAFAKMHGYEIRELIGMKWKDLVYPDDRSLVEENIRRRISGETNSAHYEFRVLRKNSTLMPVEVYGAMTHHQGRPAIIGTIMDISERKRTQEELARRAADLARSNADLEHFAYIASHDLQEPLRAVAGFTDLLARRYKGRLDKDADEFIDFALSGANRMKQLVNDLLAYSRVGTKAKAFAPTDCGAAFDQAIRNLAITIEEHYASIRVTNPFPIVMADKTQLIQVFQNLIANAIKFHGSEPPRIDVSAEKKDGEWLFCVRDNGIGIDPRHVDRIFAVFQRLHSQQEYPGTGIGLAICKKIVERHGGRIWVDSQPGRGSSFYFTLPPE